MAGYPAGCTPSPDGGIVCAPGIDPFGSLHLGPGGLSIPGYNGSTIGSGLPSSIPFNLGNYGSGGSDLGGFNVTPDIFNQFTQNVPVIGDLLSGISGTGNAVADAINKFTGTFSTVEKGFSSTFTFLSDFTRVMTVIFGLVLLLIGVVMLGLHEPVVNAAINIAKKVPVVPV